MDLSLAFRTPLVPGLQPRARSRLGGILAAFLGRFLLGFQSCQAFVVGLLDGALRMDAGAREGHLSANRAVLAPGGSVQGPRFFLAHLRHPSFFIG